GADAAPTENGAEPGAAPDARDTGPDGQEAQAAGDADAEYANVHRGLVHAAIDELATSLATVGGDTLSAWWVSREGFGRIDEGGYLSTQLIVAAASQCAYELVASDSYLTDAQTE